MILYIILNRLVFNLGYLIHGTFCAANWLILANFDQNFVTPEISVNQVRKCWPAYGWGVLPVQDTKNGMGMLMVLSISNANFLITLVLGGSTPISIWTLKAAPKLLIECVRVARTHFVANFLSGQNAPCYKVDMYLVWNR